MLHFRRGIILGMLFFFYLCSYAAINKGWEQEHKSCAKHYLSVITSFYNFWFIKKSFVFFQILLKTSLWKAFPHFSKYISKVLSFSSAFYPRVPEHLYLDQSYLNKLRRFSHLLIYISYQNLLSEDHTFYRILYRSWAVIMHNEVTECQLKRYHADVAYWQSLSSIKITFRYKSLLYHLIA